MELSVVSASIASIVSASIASIIVPDSLRRPPDAEVLALTQDLQHLRSCILDLSKENDDSTSSMRKSLIIQLQEHCYDAEDYLEMVQHSSGACSWKINWILSKAKRRCPPVSAKDIYDLRSRVKPSKEIAQALREAYKSASSRSTNEDDPRPQEEPDRRHVYSDDSLEFIGHDEPINEMLELLALESDQQLKSVAIHGSAGVGKTTLARRLYHYYEGRFHCRAFLRVSRNPDTRTLLASLLSILKGQQCHYRCFDDEQDLIDNIRQHLQGKSYLIVVDDLWDRLEWDIMSSAFPMDNCGSRIITTTQVKEVALACCNHHLEDVFNMKRLNDDQSLQLFNNRVNHIEGYNAEKCKEISYGIVKKCCDGLPLAIINIAGMLAGWRDFEGKEWESVSKCLFQTLTASPTTEEAMEGFLNLIYNNLPTKLKTCLLYLSMYPEGCVIGKDDLVRQWVAEGILKHVEGQGEEIELGSIYFDELLKRGLIQPVDIDYNNQVLSCTVHQVVLNFITRKSMQENFITVVDYPETLTELPDNKVHRLSVRFGRAKSAQIPRSYRISQVRSFMFSGFVKSVPSLDKYCLLRVMNLHVWSDQDKHVLKLSPIGNMFQLRYLKVQCNMTVKLPLIIGGMRHLQTLEVDAERVFIPIDFFSLKSLLHLHLLSKTYVLGGGAELDNILAAISLLSARGIGRLTSLQSLGYIDLSTCSRITVWQLGKLTNLQDLHLTCSPVRPWNRNRNIKCLASVLGKCTSLKSLILRGEASSNQSISFDDLSSLSSPPANLERFVLSPRMFKMSRLPKWIEQLRKLCTLKIAVGELSSDDVGILKGLPALCALSLYVRSIPKDERWIEFSEGFHFLKYFMFTCTALCVKFSRGAMPAVQRLNICFNAHTMQQYRPEDTGIGYLVGLKVLSAKIGAAGTDQASREAAKGLVDAFIRNHPNSPIRNVQMVDWVIHGDTEECSTDVQDASSSVRKHTRSALLPSLFTRRGPDQQHTIKENDVVEDIVPRESSSLMQKPGWVTRRPRTGVRLVRTMRGFTYMIRQHMKQPGFHIMNEMASINQEMRRMTTITDSNTEKEPPEWVLQVQDLAYDVEDFLDIYKWLHIRSRRHALAHVSHIGNLKDRIRSLREWQPKCISRHDRCSGAALSFPQASGPYAPEDVLVGIDKPRNELLELIFEREVIVEEVSPWIAEVQKPRVVSIIGYSGIGKTALARSLYYDPCVRSAFNCVAWVVASECSHGGDLLNKIFQQVKEQVNGVVPDFYMLKDILRNKRFLVVIDDLQEAGMWYDIKDVFGETHNGSRIIVTSSIQSVATTCTPMLRYIYRMQSLDNAESEKLLWMRVGRRPNRSPALEYALGDTLKKCCGLPLALISVANHLCQKEHNLPQGAPGAFEEMDRVLTKCYDRLPDNAHRMCLLSLSTFPQGHLIKRKRLIRRWIAEGLAVGDGDLSPEQVASNIFDVLIDRNIIEPVLIGNDSKVKACLILSVIKDFIINKSVTKEIVTIIQNDDLLLPNKTIARPVRRLFVHGGTTHSEGVARGIGLGQVRSLTICKTAPFYLQRFWLLRVLDLEACQGVDKRVVRNICKLVFLKYLSLRGSDVYRISKKIKRLEYLETLDIRDTRVEALPIEVFMLPGLVHLFGKFELPRQLKHQMTRSRLQAFFSEKSRLQTLSGFFIDSNSFVHIMINISLLRKVKVWCKHSISSYRERLLASSLQKRLVGNNALESLSIDFGNESINFLNDIGAPYALISSMKLQGRLTSLPSFMTSYDTTLSKLQLSSTGLGIEALSLLQNLRRLIYLKLVQDGDGFWGTCFVVQSDGFPSLLCLCFEAPELPQLHIYEGGMSSLTSLQLLCPMFAGCDNSDLGEKYVETYSEKSSMGVHSVEKLKGVDPQTSSKEISPEMRSQEIEIEETGSNKKSEEVDSNISLKNMVLEKSFRINFLENVKGRIDLKTHFKGIEHLQCLNELLLHPSVSNEVLEAWKEEARNHINRPKVKRQHRRALSLSRGLGTTNNKKEGQHISKLKFSRDLETEIQEKEEGHSSGKMSHEKAVSHDQTSDKGKEIQEEEQQPSEKEHEEGKSSMPTDGLHHLAWRMQSKTYMVTEKMMLHEGHVNHDYEYIRSVLGVMAAYLADVLSQNGQLVPQEKWILQLQDLVYDIEDFVDIYDYMCIRSRIRALAHLSNTEHLKVRVESLYGQQRLEYIPSAKSCKREDSAPLSRLLTPSYLFIGMDVTITELGELVCQEESDVKHRVISIVGCPGLGKTTLAKALYNQELIRKLFDTFVCVSASECSSAEDLRNKVIEQASNVYPPKTREATPNDMDLLLREILAEKRCLIIIDDLREIKLWMPIQDALATTSMASRIIVTTSIQSIAERCSRYRFIYRMEGLGPLESQDLFLRTAYGHAYPKPGVADALEEISRRCDGLPLALVSAADVWREQGWEEKFSSYNPVPLPLGAFEEANRIFSRWYQSLPDATCMLSLGIFPNGHPIKRKSLIRKWIAEGLVEEYHEKERQLSAEQVGDQRFDELIDQSIIEPVATSNNSKAKMCRVRGPVLEFIVKESVSKNMVTLLRGDEPLRKGRCPHPTRVLSVHQTTETTGGRIATEIGFDRIRSLTIFNRGMAFDLQQCAHLRVLDVEGCKGVDKRFVAGICKLVLLKYLSLRGSDVDEIPKEIAKLESLETLDVRETAVDELPMEAIMLPQLVHLFGMFKLTLELQRSKAEKFFREESKLQTLSGLVMVGSHGYEHLVLHMRRLRKVKIWCVHGMGGLSQDFVSSFEKRLTGHNALDSLSIDFGDGHMGWRFADYFTNTESSGPCKLRSIKLRGGLPGRLLKFITSPANNNLSELQLSFTGLQLKDLSILQSLSQLLYLKLVENWGGFGDIFVVKKDGFESLERLCFEEPNLPHVRICEGAMPALTSLHLLCPDHATHLRYYKRETENEDTTSEIEHGKTWGIEYLENLNEIVLHASAGGEQVDFWEEKARKHINRPKIVIGQPTPK